MEVEQSARVVAKKLWKVVRIVFYMLKTGMPKSKITVDLNLILKRSHEAITNLFFRHLHHHRHQNHHLHHHRPNLYSSFTCRSGTDVISSALTREYEFSCSNSPAYPFAALYHHKRKHHHHYRSGGQLDKVGYGYDDVTTVTAVQRVLEMLSNNDMGMPPAAVAESPLVMLPGFGQRSPTPVRQLRVTDSPFPLKEEEGGGDAVDKAAEEFINRFYKNLKLQKKMASAIESPYNNTWGR